MAHQIAKNNLRRAAKSPPTAKGGLPIGAAAPPDLTGLGAAPPPALAGMDGGQGAPGLPMGGPAGGPTVPPPTGLGLGQGGAGFKPSDLVKRGQSKPKGGKNPSVGGKAVRRD